MNFSKLEQLIDTMPQRGIPFCDIAITKDGEEVFRRSVGFSDSEGKKPTSRDDLYWIYSASKVITCVTAMRLVEEGKLHLNDPVSQYLPSFGDLKIQNPDGTLVPVSNTMTIEHIFTMTGGMNYDIENPVIKEACARPGAGTISIADAMAKIPLGFEPGTRYRYSLCHDVLAAVVEVITGIRFADYVKQVIFDPLGMKDSGFHPTEDQKKRFTAAYRYENGNGTSKLIPDHFNRFDFLPNYDSGGAGVFSCVDDYIRFVTVLACGGTSKDGYLLLRPESIAQMEVNRLCPAALHDFAVSRLYGYGWGLCGRVHVNPAVSLSKAAVGEFGWDGAAGAFAMVDRKNHVALYYGMEVLGCNYGYNVLHPLMRNLAYEGLES